MALRFHAFLTGALLLVVTLSLAHAQTPRTVRQYYERGQTRYEQGDFDGAIADFTAAIGLASQLLGGAGKHFTYGWKEGDGARGPGEELGGPRALDPRAALAYGARGVARFRKKEYDSAIADFNQAIRISPRLVEA